MDGMEKLVWAAAYAALFAAEYTYIYTTAVAGRVV
jgi:hypothetical protein